MNNNFFAILHNIRSTYNVGAIFRTADAVGIDKLYLTGYTPTPAKDKKIEKTALGAEKYVTWEYYQNISYLLKKLKKESFQIVALEQNEKSIPYYQFKPKFPLVLIVGNEVKGLNKKILNYADYIIEIPMFGKKESLNVAVAFGIVVYYLKFYKYTGMGYN
ncbi:MAG: rRNA methyltransferase [Candidatus Parcubacteria bacterium]|nr:MAG: rRNA methyltransferase [Candidatus Parcubacteria bacterium]